MSLPSVETLSDSPVASSDFSATESRRIVLYETVIELKRAAAGLSLWCSDPDTLARQFDFSGMEVCPIPGGIPSAPIEGIRLLWLEDAPDDLESHILGICPEHILSVLDDDPLAGELARWGYLPKRNKPWHYELANPATVLRTLIASGQRDRLAALLPRAIGRSTSSAECVELAFLSEQVGNQDLRFSAIERAVSLDRNNTDALVMMAAASLGKGLHALSLLSLDELSRKKALPEGARELYAKLSESLGENSIIKGSRAANGLLKDPLAATPRRILVVTNLFPPQELGGYGRQLWEFAQGLSARGHSVSVLAGDQPSLAKAAGVNGLDLESKVQRTLKLAGTWGPEGAKFIEDKAEIGRRIEHNKSLVKKAISSTRAEVVLLGNIDFLGVSIVDCMLEQGVPVLHALGLSYPGYTTDDQPMHPNYCLASGSYWLATQVSNSGYFPARSEVIYPGARTDSFFKLIRPDRSRLRLCYAGLVMQYKGVHTLVDAAIVLADKGVDFTLEIAGDSLTPDFVAKLKEQVREAGISDLVKFTGFLDREGLDALFARSNVLVFPSICNEVFGISQVEALASGLVVVTTGTGGAREIVRNNVDGLLFEPQNRDALADALMRLATDPALFERLQASTQSRALEFSTGRSVAKLEAAFEQMVAMA